METIVGEDGEVTLPEWVLSHLGLKEGSEVEFAIEADGSVVMRRAPSEG